VIRSRGLAHRWAGGPHLRFPDLDLPQGGTLLLLGASGAGKSTWLSLVAGLLAVQEGELEVAGEHLRRLSAPRRDAWRGRCIGFLPQKLHLSEALTVEQNLRLVFFATQAVGTSAHPTIQEALAVLGVGELAARKPAQLSGGQAQRVALARAVLLSPRVILADEPTASLDDAAAEAAVWLLCQAAQRCGATLVIATHDRRVREALAQAQVLQLRAEVPA